MSLISMEFLTFVAVAVIGYYLIPKRYQWVWLLAFSYIYYASSDTRMHVATTTVDKLEDYLFNTPCDPHRSPDCVKQRCELIAHSLELLK